MSTAQQWGDLVSTYATLTLVLLWLGIGGRVAVELWRRRRGAGPVVDEVQALHDVVNGYGHDLLQEAESLREVVEGLRDDAHRDADRLAGELGSIRAAVAQLVEIERRRADGGAR